MSQARPGQAEKAERFRELHRAAEILVLPNAWDAASALAFEGAGFPAVGTSGTGIALSYGRTTDAPDFEEMIWTVERMIRRVEVPVSIDIDEGFADTTAGVLGTIDRVIAIGGVGINIDDLAEDGGGLLEAELFAERLSAIRDHARARGVPLVINARTDVFLAELGDPVGRLDHAIRRARAYRESGADCIFVPGKGLDRAAIKVLVEAIEGPLNISINPGISEPGPLPIAELAELGVARVSIGAAAMKASLRLTEALAAALRAGGGYDLLGG